MSSNSFLGVSLPEKSILDEADYRRIYAAASDLSNATILSTLESTGAMRPDEFGQTIPDAASRLSRLAHEGLVCRRTDGLYRTTTLGRTVVTHGPTDGVRRLMENEWEFERRYA